jgi:hypothetical protein
VTVNGFWINDWIYWTLTLVTTSNYDSLNELHIPNITVTIAHIKSSSVFTRRWLVEASNGGRSSSSGFPNCPRPQLPPSHFSQLQLSTESTNSSYTSITTDGQSASLSWCQAPSGAQDQIVVTVRQLWVCWCGEPSLTSGPVWRLQLLLALASGHTRVWVLRDSWPYFTVSD